MQIRHPTELEPHKSCSMSLPTRFFSLFSSIVHSAGTRAPRPDSCGDLEVFVQHEILDERSRNQVLQLLRGALEHQVWQIASLNRNTRGEKSVLYSNFNFDEIFMKIQISQKLLISVHSSNFHPDQQQQHFHIRSRHSTIPRFRGISPLIQHYFMPIPLPSPLPSDPPQHSHFGWRQHTQTHKAMSDSEDVPESNAFKFLGELKFKTTLSKDALHKASRLISLVKRSKSLLLAAPYAAEENTESGWACYVAPIDKLIENQEIESSELSRVRLALGATLAEQHLLALEVDPTETFLSWVCEKGFAIFQLDEVLTSQNPIRPLFEFSNVQEVSGWTWLDKEHFAMIDKGKLATGEILKHNSCELKYSLLEDIISGKSIHYILHPINFYINFFLKFVGVRHQKDSC